MNNRLRRAAPVLVVVVAAVLLAWLRMGQGPAPPAGSSRSPAADGALALSRWAEARGRRADRVDAPGRLPETAPSIALVLAPAVPLDRAARRALDAVPAGGGTLILAGPVASYRGVLEAAGITAATTPLQRQATPPGGGPSVRLEARQRLGGDGTTPLLVAPNGATVAVRKPYLNGSVVVVAGVQPFTNAGLADDGAAGFVYHLVFDATPQGATVLFDETHYSAPATADAPLPTFDGLLRGTPAGRAVIYAAGLTVLFLLLGGKRLGPPLAAAAPTAPGRTMFEQVQALGGLYRRAGQLTFLRQHYVGHFERAIVAAGGLPPARREAAVAALRQIEAAATETALLAAVNRVAAILSEREEDARRRRGYGTLTDR
jgi:hypothetical protein